MQGRAANDVETEQIVFEDVTGGYVTEISSVVQIRGSISLLWSQETSRILRQTSYTKEKKPRESILHVEFVKAVSTINRGLDNETRLKFRTVDLTRLFHLKGSKVLTLLTKVAGNALDETGIFYCALPPFMDSKSSLSLSFMDSKPLFSFSHITTELEDTNDYSHPETMRFQSGVLRTNCIDCLDHTNVAQYAYGLVALGHQLHAIGINPTRKIDLDDSCAYKLMGLYEAMGDTLAFQ